MRASFADLARSGVLTYGDGYRTKSTELGQPGFPVLRVAQVAEGQVVHGGATDWVRLEFARQIGPKLSAAGDVVLTTKGTFGRRARIGPESAGWVYSPQVCYFRVNDPSRLDRGFLYSWLGSKEFLDQARARTAQTDMADYLSLRDLGTIEIPVPAIREQRAIAHILGTLDDKIELNRKMSETLEEMARALFKSWFVDFDPVRAMVEGRETGMPTHLANLFPATLEESDQGQVPKGWKVGTLGQIAQHPRRGLQPHELEPDTPYIALEHMPKRSIALHEWGNADGLASNKCAFKRGEILFGKLRPYFHKVGVAPVDGVCSTDIVVIAPTEPEWMSLCLCLVSSDAFVAYTNAGSTGTKMPRTSWGEMARYTVAIPPQNVAAAFDEQVRPWIERIVAGIHESHTLAGLRDTLLPKLISGEFRVKDAERFVQEAV